VGPDSPISTIRSGIGDSSQNLNPLALPASSMIQWDITWGILRYIYISYVYTDVYIYIYPE
jgi:hypothetical protein